MNTVSLPKKRNCVPDSQFPFLESTTGYYGAPLLKEKQWQREIPLYFFAGGAAGAAALTACMADWLSGDDRLVNHARWIAAGGGLLSGALLTKDLAAPHRFMNMLRLFQRQSPMSAGAWTLAIFSTFSGAAAFANQIRQELDGLPILLVENVSGVIAAITGLVMSACAGVLIGGRAVPVWNQNIGELSACFAASGMNSAVSLLELLGHSNSRALNLLGLASSACESFAGLMLETKRKRADEPLRKGASGRMVRAGGVLSGPVPLLLRIAHLITGNRDLRRAAACSSLAGSLLTRFGWVHAGKASANDYQLPLELTA